MRTTGAATAGTAGAVLLGSVLLLPGPIMPGRAAPAPGDAPTHRTEVYRQALEAFYAGDDVTAAARFAVLADVEDGPGGALARDYLADRRPIIPAPRRPR